MPKKQEGFSLIEVLVAITILACGLVLVVQAMGRTQQALRLSENLALAAQIAEEKLAGLEIGARQRDNLSLASDHGDERLPGKMFEWSTRVQPFAHETIQDETKLHMISVEVGWKEGPAGKSLSAYSLVLSRGKRV